MNVGDSQTFNYTGGMQTFTIPNKGIYKLEVWGCTSGGAGGYSKGYKKFNTGTTLYICCGGRPYNGGGSGNQPGGGATHIALVNGTLASIGKTSFVTNGNGLIVAGGGGGAWGSLASGVGGSGGGTSGGMFSWGPPPGSSVYFKVYGGTQSAGGTCEGNGYTLYSGSFGKGGAGAEGGAGGGFYGGGAAYSSSAHCGGAGGSGWIGGVPSFTDKGITYSPSMSSGVWASTGKATITLMSKQSVKLGDLDCEVYLGDTQIDEIKFGNIDIG